LPPNGLRSALGGEVRLHNQKKWTLPSGLDPPQVRADSDAAQPEKVGRPQ